MSACFSLTESFFNFNIVGPALLLLAPMSFTFNNPAWQSASSSTTIHKKSDWNIVKFIKRWKNKLWFRDNLGSLILVNGPRPIFKGFWCSTRIGAWCWSREMSLHVYITIEKMTTQNSSKLVNRINFQKTKLDSYCTEFGRWQERRAGLGFSPTDRWRQYAFSHKSAREATVFENLIWWNWMGNFPRSLQMIF